MWFESDSVFPYSPTNDLSLRDPGFDTGPLKSDARSLFSEVRAEFARDDLSRDMGFPSDRAELDGLFSPLTTIADEWGEIVLKDGGREMNGDDRRHGNENVPT